MLNKTKSLLGTKIYLRLLTAAVFASMAFYFNGCILDAFNTLTQELPYSQNISIAGTENSVEKSQTVDLNENDFYNNNKSKIESIEFVKLAYKTKSVSPANLEGTIKLTVKQSNGTTIFSKTIPGAKPSDYLVNPYELPISAAEMQLMNLYLSSLSNRQFTATVSVQTSTQGTKSIEATVYAVFKMKYKP